MKELKTEKEWELELIKCNDSPAYFYNNYYKKEGDADITDKDIEVWREEMLWSLVKAKLKPRNPETDIRKIFNDKLPDYFK